jgi:lipid-binding SYLF domain-containing protein
MSTRVLVLALACAMFGADGTVVAQSDEAERIQEAAKVFGQIMSAEDKAIPNAILEKAEAIAVFPGTIKAGLGIGGQRGKGIISVRNRASGSWSNPAFLTLTGGSFGAQIGAEEIDLVLVVMNKAGVEHLMGNEFKIAADASVAAGPVGRGAEAATDAQLQAQILSYSRARGLFAGVSLTGSAIREDEDANKGFYGRPLRNREILSAATPVGTSGKENVPAAVATWHQTLSKHIK